jgi:hypothetical protein
MDEMRLKGLKPTKNTYLAALNALAEVRAIVSHQGAASWQCVCATVYVLSVARVKLTNGALLGAKALVAEHEDCLQLTLQHC